MATHSGKALLAAVKAVVEGIPEAGPVYDYSPSFEDFEAMERANKVVLADETERIRLWTVEQTWQRRGMSNATYEVVHTVQLMGYQRLASTPPNPDDPYAVTSALSEIEMRDMAELVCAGLGDPKPSGPLGTAIGAGWLGFDGEGPRLVPDGIQAVEWNGATWHRSPVTLVALEEVDID